MKNSKKFRHRGGLNEPVASSDQTHRICRKQNLFEGRAKLSMNFAENVAQKKMKAQEASDTNISNSETERALIITSSSF